MQLFIEPGGCVRCLYGETVDLRRRVEACSLDLFAEGELLFAVVQAPGGVVNGAGSPAAAGAFFRLSKIDDKAWPAVADHEAMPAVFGVLARQAHAVG